MASLKNQDGYPDPIPSHPTKTAPITVSGKLHNVMSNNSHFTSYLSIAFDIIDHFLTLETLSLQGVKEPALPDFTSLFWPLLFRFFGWVHLLSLTIKCCRVYSSIMGTFLLAVSLLRKSYPI